MGMLFVDGLLVHPLAVLAVLIFAIWVRSRFLHGRSLPLPPGPKGYPLVGNVKDIPDSEDRPWVKYRDLSAKYGDLTYMQVFGRSILVLNSLKAITDLLERRSATYSDRPAMPMINDLMGWEWQFAQMPYGDYWRRHRKVFHQYFNSNTMRDHRPVQSDKTVDLLRRLLAHPDDFIEHIRHHSGSIILSLTYGYEIQSDSSDYFVNLVSRAVAGNIAAGNPGTYAVDFLPILKHLPSWLPGAGFKRKAAEWRKPVYEMRDAPFIALKRKMAKGTAVPCFTTTNLENLSTWDAPPDQEDIIRNAAAVAYLAGSDTTVSALTSFVLAMVLHPEIQQRAQEELDRVVGRDKLPTFDDQDNLPYIRAIVLETMRWNPVVPLAIAHRAIEEDVYGGYRIPKGTLVLPNTWALMHDPSLYHDPMLYKPERFLKHDNREPEIDPLSIGAFGYGRRVCPGRHLAEGTMFIAIASVLSTFNITKTVDLDGKVIEPLVEYKSGLVSHPTPFVCSIRPRSKDAEKVIMSSHNA